MARKFKATSVMTVECYDKFYKHMLERFNITITRQIYKNFAVYCEREAVAFNPFQLAGFIRGISAHEVANEYFQKSTGEKKKS